MNLPESGHDPVLVAEVLEALKLGDPAAPEIAGRQGPYVYVDCTLGRGGHARAVGERLQRLGLAGQMVCMDTDERNLQFAAGRLEGVGGPGVRKRLFHANFAELTEVWKQVSAGSTGSEPKLLADGILADLGVSTNQLFDPAYGMSMSVSGDLDMRLDRSRGISAAEIVNRWPEEKIADVLYSNADERFSRRIARKVIAERRVSPILTTERLAELVRSALRPVTRPGEPGSIDPATRTFQALRMEANEEVGNLERLLQQATGLLARGGRFAVISFHSGEDRIVKQAFKLAEMTGSFRVICKKPITPTEAEITVNPRSRSAKLRVLERV